MELGRFSGGFGVFAGTLTGTAAVCLAAAGLAGALWISAPAQAQQAGNADEFYIVDCLLPGKVKKLGRRVTFLSPRRPVRTTQRDCEIRGGEYVAYDRANYATALKIWLPQAQEGDPKAQTYVGEMAEKGLGQAPDYEMAALWYGRAAKQGYAPAQVNLGQLYEKGLGVPQDMTTAVMWYRRASGVEDAGLQTVAFGDSAAEIDRLQSALDERGQEVDALRQELDALGTELNRARAEGRKVDAEMAEQSRTLQLARQDLARQRQALEAERAAMARKEQTMTAEQQQAEQAMKADVERQKQAMSVEQQQAKQAMQADLDRQKQAMTAEQQRAKEAMVAEMARRSEQLDAKERELAAREAEHAAREAEVQAKKDEVAKLDTEVAKRRQQIAALQQPASTGTQEPAAAPQITMIEPRLPKARGNDMVILTRSDVPSRTIVGKVVAPKGLYQLLVNDREVEVDDNAMFQARIPIADGAARVQIVALDAQGRRGELAFELRHETANGQAAAKVPARAEEPEARGAAGVDFGRFHALIIGNVDYKDLPKLNTPHNDAKVLAELLETKYGFKTTVLLDATRYEILATLNKLRAELTENDNLLVYYAGHGELDQVNERGHWLPVDAEGDNTANWISNISLTDVINAMSVRKVLIIADSCYSGSLTRSTLARLDAGRSPEAWKSWLELMATKKSRTAMTSGGLAPVLDGGGGRHSIFAKALIDALGENKGVIDGRTLHQIVAQGVSYSAAGANIEQVPQYAPIRFAGHEAGDFFFIPRT